MARDAPSPVRRVRPGSAADEIRLRTRRHPGRPSAPRDRGSTGFAGSRRPRAAAAACSSRGSRAGAVPRRRPADVPPASRGTALVIRRRRSRAGAQATDAGPPGREPAGRRRAGRHDAVGARVVQTLRVSSINMVPKLATGDHVMVRSYGAGPVPGDVIVYRSPSIGTTAARPRRRRRRRAVEMGREGSSPRRPLGGSELSSSAYDCPENALRAATGLGAGVRWRRGRRRLQPGRLPRRGLPARRETLGDHTYSRGAPARFGPDVPSTPGADRHVFVLSDNPRRRAQTRASTARIPPPCHRRVLSFVY